MTESDVDAVRKRPGMYIGDVRDGSGLHHMVWEVVSNSIDEHLAGHCDRIDVAIAPDGSIAVEDNGRGFRFDSVDGKPFAEIALTSLHGTATLDGHAPHEHVGLLGVGVFVVSALSTWVRLDVWRDGRHRLQRFERGVAVTGVEDLGATERSGTRLAFAPDPDVFGDTWFDAGTIAARLRELAFLRPQLTLFFRDDRDHTFHEPKGITARVAQLCPVPIPSETFALTGEEDDLALEVAVSWQHHGHGIESYANIERTTAGGTHATGLMDGLVAGLRTRARAHCKGRRAKKLVWVLAPGMSGIVTVRLNDPTYGAPTKSRLDEPRVARFVRRQVGPAFADYLAKQPVLLKHFTDALEGD